MGRDSAEPGDWGVYTERLPPAALSYRTVRSLIDLCVGIGLGLAATFMFVPEWWRPIIFGLLGADLVLALYAYIPVLLRRRVRNTRYAVDALTVRVRRGVLFRREMVISTAQLLSVTIIDGPLLRAFGLVNVLYTTIKMPERLGPVTVVEANALRE